MLELRNVSAGYDGRNVIQGISLSFEPGKIYTIVGRNGSGKSTLLKICAGLLNPGDGDVLLDGKKLSQYLPIERAKTVSYLSQSRSTPALSVERLVGHGRYPRLASPRKLSENDLRIIERSLEQMQLTHLRCKSLKELSGGERQRAYLAMLLAQDTQVLLLDEPTTYMDIEHQLALMKLLRELSQRGKCIVMALHDLSHALNCSDEMIAMDGGKMRSCASPETMLAGGVLEEIFHVRVKSVYTPGKSYILNIEEHVSG